MAINTRYFDRRTTDRYVEKGLLKETELNSHLKNLPDEEKNAQYVQMDLHDAEITEEGNNSGESEEGA
jgi:hypothetical protein